MGFSMGGPILTKFAQLFPDLTRKMIYCAPCGTRSEAVPQRHGHAHAYAAALKASALKGETAQNAGRSEPQTQPRGGGSIVYL